MKILAAGDLHGDTIQAQKLADLAVKEDVDAIFLTGDLTQASESLDGIVGPFAATKKKVFLIHGNHESVAVIEFLAEKYGAVNLHGKSTTIGDIGIFACGGANIGMDALDDDQIFEYLETAHSEVKEKRKIMITHNHPSGSKIEKFTQFFPGSPGVERAIKEFQPELLICSHVHEADGVEEMMGTTKVINVGRSGKIINMG